MFLSMLFMLKNYSHLFTLKTNIIMAAKDAKELSAELRNLRLKALPGRKTVKVGDEFLEQIRECFKKYTATMYYSYLTLELMMFPNKEVNHLINEEIERIGVKDFLDTNFIITGLSLDFVPNDFLRFLIKRKDIINTTIYALNIKKHIGGIIEREKVRTGEVEVEIANAQEKMLIIENLVEQMEKALQDATETCSLRPATEQMLKQAKLLEKEEREHVKKLFNALKRRQERIILMQTVQKEYS